MREVKLSVNRVIRGGGWFNNAPGLRAAIRIGISPSGQFATVGGRLSTRFVRSKR